MTSNPNWTEHYFANKYDYRIEEYETFYKNDITLWKPFAEDVVLKDAYENFNICHGIFRYFGINYIDVSILKIPIYSGNTKRNIIVKVKLNSNLLLTNVEFASHGLLEIALAFVDHHA